MCKPEWSAWGGNLTLAPGIAHTININFNQVGPVIDQILISDDPNFVPTY